MSKINTILIFDIGKTNKKVLLFDHNLQIQVEEEIQFPEIKDDEGFPCDDLDTLEKWIDQTLIKYLNHEQFNVLAVNFTTFGATLVHLDKQGARLTPAYNYLKPMPSGIVESFYDRYGGIGEFCRRSASPALGMLNSGLQILWLKKNKPEIFKKVASSLHLPQYFSFRLTGKIVSEHTSIGCHTGMWDFDHMQYHPWLKDEGIILPSPVSVEQAFKGTISGLEVNTGTGIHDSSASLAPYIKAGKDEFILLSTGTWCISMNPFNHTPLTAEQLEKDCLCYMSINQKPVKSSRFFLGHIHDLNVERLTSHFGIAIDYYKKVKLNENLLHNMLNGMHPTPVFFANGIPENYIDNHVDPGKFSDFEEAYHRLMADLTNLVIDSLHLIIPENDNTSKLFISGGFAKNDFFTRLLATYFRNKKVYTSKIDNATSLGAALVMYSHLGTTTLPEVNLDLKEVNPL